MKRRKRPADSRDASPPSSTPAQDTVRALLPFLAGLAHRHRNQHGPAAWWTRFGLFRRGVTRFCSASRPRDVLAQAEWLAHRIIPTAYMYDLRVPISLPYAVACLHGLLLTAPLLRAFSQVAADNRHAPLGLALLGILASVSHALQPVVSLLPPAGTALTAPTDAVQVHESLHVRARLADDLGTALSRDEVETRSAVVLSEAVTVASPPSDMILPRPSLLSSEGAARKEGQSKRKKKRAENDVAWLFESII